jgi:hypothetical protein
MGSPLQKNLHVQLQTEISVITVKHLMYLTIERHFLSVHDQYERDSQEISLKSKSVHIDHKQIKNDARLLYLYFFNF